MSTSSVPVTGSAMRRVLRDGNGPLTRRAGNRWKRAAAFIEFAIVLPIFVFMMVFTIDMGTVMLMSGAVNDATFSAARAGAQAGGAMAGSSPGGKGVSERTFDTALAQVPFNNALYASKTFSIKAGSQCTSTEITGAGTTVKVQVDYGVNLITPGLESMLNMFSDGSENADGFNLSAVGVARCEVFRR